MKTGSVRRFVEASFSNSNTVSKNRLFVTRTLLSEAGCKSVMELQILSRCPHDRIATNKPEE